MVRVAIRSVSPRIAAWAEAFGLALTREIFPWGGRLREAFRRPMVVLCAILAAGVTLAVFVNPGTASACAAIAVVIAVGRGWPSLVMRGLDGTMHVAADRGVEGEAVRVTVRVRNAWPWPVWGITLDVGEEGGAAVALAALPSRSTTEFALEVVPGRRGVYPRGPVRLVTGFPFGLSLVSRPLRVERPALVWPATVPLEGLPGGAASSAPDALAASRRGGDVDDVTDTRPFRPGDTLRKVHWPMTARVGDLVACERQSPITPVVRVVVHRDVLDEGDDGPTGVLESALRVAASVCRAYHAGQARVECHIGAESIPVAPGHHGLRRFLDTVARFDAAAVRSRPGQGGRMSASGSATAFEIVITTHRSAVPAGQPAPSSERLVVMVEPHALPVGDPPPDRATGRVVRVRTGGGVLAAFAASWRGMHHA